MNNGILCKEDILCMQYAGMKSSRIMNPKLTPEEYAEAFEAYIDKAESVMSRKCYVDARGVWHYYADISR